MIKNILNYVKKQKNVFEKENKKVFDETFPKKVSVEDEFLNLSNELDNFSDLLKTSSNKNIILKNYDILDLNIIEFLNKHGRSSVYGKKAVELSKKLSEFYNYFKENINLYIDQPLVKEEKREEPKLNIRELYEDLRKRLNEFKNSVNENKLTEDEIENFILLFNDEIHELIKNSDEEYKLRFTELKNKLVNFYKEIQNKFEQELIEKSYENDLNKAKQQISTFNLDSEKIISLIKSENKSEHQILEINNKIFESKEKFKQTQNFIEEKLSKRDQPNLLNKLNNIFDNLDKSYLKYIENLASVKNTLSVKIEKPKEKTSIKLFKIINNLKSSPLLKLKLNQEKIKQKKYLISEETVKILTEVLNNIEIYQVESLKEIFTNNYQIYENYILNTDYDLLVKSLLDDLEKNINNLEENERTRIKRNVIAKESYNSLKNIISYLENYSLEELQIIFEKNLENYKNYSKYTLFGVKINSYLNQLNEHINSISHRKEIQENLSKIFLDNLNNTIANFESYSVTYLSNILEKSTNEYNKYYSSSKLSRSMEFSIQNLSNTLALLKILVSYLEKDLVVIENQRVLLRDVIFNVYSQLFSLNNNFSFSRKSRKSLKKLEKVFNLEIKRKLMLEELNNKIISLNLNNNAYLKLLMNNLISKKPQSAEDLKDTFLDISKKVTKKELLNEALVKLMELANTVLPLRKKSLLELKTKLL